MKTKTPNQKSDETVRKCIVSGKTYPKECLIRFVLSPKNEVVPDVAQKLPGRGVWVFADEGFVQTALIKGLFAKAFKSKVAYLDGMTDLIRSQLQERGLSMLSMAKKSGLVTAGFEKLKEALTKGRIVYVLEATDAGQDGVEKISRLAKGVPVLKAFTAEKMGRALGRDNCVHLGLAAGSFSEKLVAEVGRYLSYCSSKEENVDRELKSEALKNN